jgi:hypothetical protein
MTCRPYGVNYIRGWRIHCLSCMRPTNTRNIPVVAPYPWPVLASQRSPT